MATKTEIQDFSRMVEENAVIYGITRMDAIIHHCENTGMEVEVASTLISPALKAKISEEAMEARLIKATGRLPL